VQSYKVYPFNLYGCETLSVTLREEHIPRVFESTVRRTLFRNDEEEAAGGWRKLHNMELYNL
jgi:hypothetical protein